jgi:endonuclease YncB( thermonuclease family)
LDQTCGEDRSKLWFCGESAADALKKRISGHDLRCEVRGFDRYHRFLGLCSADDGTDINAWAVREGWAVAYGPGHVYQDEESKASRAQRGIWSSQFIRPSQWREQGRHDNKLYEGD